MVKELKKRFAQVQKQIDTLTRYTLQQSASQLRALKRELDRLARRLDTLSRRRAA